MFEVGTDVIFNNLHVVLKISMAYILVNPGLQKQ